MNLVREDEAVLREDTLVSEERTAANSAFDRKVIREVVRRHGDAMATCPGASTDEPILITTQFVISTTGTISSVKLAEPSTHEELALCIMREVMKMRFPAPARGGVVQVRYPFSVSL